MKNNRFLFIIVFALLVSYTTNAQIDAANNVVVKTEAGKVRGQVSAGISIFKNIPYAAAPVGNLRFAAPVKHPAWLETRDAINSGPTAPYPQPKEGDIDDKPTLPGWVKGEDFLTANVWTPGCNRHPQSGYGLYTWWCVCFGRKRCTTF